MYVTRPTWVEINLDDFEDNVRAIRRYLDLHGGQATRVLAVVKADGYGHGAEMVARSALDCGADWLGVAILEEGIALRERGFNVPILVMGWTPADSGAAALDHDLRLAVPSYENGRALSEIAARRCEQFQVHIKVDTGMSRIGLRWDDAGVQEAVRLASLPGIEVEGAFTHFAVADEDVAFTREQIRRYRTFVTALRHRGVQVPVRHAANSAGVLDFPEAVFDMVRPGLMLYGVYPTDTVSRSVKVKPFLTWKTRVAQVKRLSPGEGVSYGRTFIAREATKVATLPVGYADGYPRGLSNRGDVLIMGRRCRIAGRVCMDQTMVMVPDDMEVEAGTEVVLLGADGSEAITVEELATAMNTIQHEIFTGIGKRVPRVFIRSGTVVHEANVLHF